MLGRCTPKLLASSRDASSRSSPARRQTTRPVSSSCSSWSFIHSRFVCWKARLAVWGCGGLRLQQSLWSRRMKVWQLWVCSLFWSGCTGGAEGGREGLLLFTWSLQRMSLKHTCSSVVPGRVRCRQNKSVLLFVVRVILVSYEAQVFKHHGRINLPGDPRGRNYLWAPQITSESNIKLLCVCSCLCCHSSTTLVGLHRSFNRPYSHFLPARSVSECRRQICASTLFVFLHQSVFTGLW